jgi:hypothetical protein
MPVYGLPIFGERSSINMGILIVTAMPNRISFVEGVSLFMKFSTPFGKAHWKLH